MRVTHDDGVELTFDKVVNDSSLYVLNRIESNRKNLFVSENRIESNWNIFFLNRNALLSIQLTALVVKNQTQYTI